MSFSMPRRPDAAAWLLVGASLLWLPQALLLAVPVQRIAEERGLDGLNGLLPWAAGVAVLGMLRAWCEGQGLRRSYVRARQRLGQLRAQVAQALAQGSPLDRSRPASGAAASAMAEQAEAIVPWLARYQPALWRVVLVPPAIALAVATQSWAAALILVVAAPLIPLFMAIVGWRAKAASEAQMVELGGMNAFLLDRLRGLATLRALGAVDATARQLRASAESLRTRTMRVLRIAFLSSAVLEFFAALGVAMVAVYVGFHLLGYLDFGAWGRTLTLGQALWILLLAPAFFEPLRELAAVWHDRASGQAAVQTLQGMARHVQPLPGALQAVAAPSPGACRVQLHGLLAQVPGGASAALAPVDLDVAPGEHIALWSPSGSGKSVLLAQLAGLVPIVQGEARIDGQPMTQDSAAALRARMGWMGQHPHVFAGSVAANVALGRDGVRGKDVDAAIASAALGQVAQARSATTLGEGGVGLSGGEAVRLALARLAVQQQAGLWLVDEPTAHLDPATAAQVGEALVRMAQGRTLIVATHDPALAARMGRVVRLAASGDGPEGRA